MTKLNTSPRVKARISCWLKRLLDYDSRQLPDLNYPDFEKRLHLEWIDSEDWQVLIVKTSSADLVELLAPCLDPCKSVKQQKGELRNDIDVLSQLLGIVEVPKRQGATNRRLIFKLCSKDTQKNLDWFESRWKHCIESRSKRSPTSPPTPSKPTEPTAPQIDHLTTAQSPEQLRHNLPALQTTFIGHKTPIARLLKLLSPEHPAHHISIEGTGGIGKTTLALEAAHRCLKATQNPQAFPGTPTFNAIIFTSAQSQSFIGPRLSQRLRPEQNLRDIFRIINRTLNYLDSLPPDLYTQHDAIRDSLARQSCLLIIDNLETLDDQLDILSFLKDIPPTVKVVLTSRVKIGFGTVLRLNCLSPEDGSLLIQHQAHEKSIQLSEPQAQSLYQKTGGLPLSIVYTIGQIAVQGLPPETILAHLNPSNSDLTHYCFEASFQQLRGQPAQQLLKAIVLFPQPATLEALAYVAFGTTQPTATHQSFTELYRRSLVELQQGRYTLHSLTREYINADLTAHPHHAQVLRTRWIIWYLKLTEPYLALDWQEWQDYRAPWSKTGKICALL